MTDKDKLIKLLLELDAYVSHMIWTYDDSPISKDIKKVVKELKDGT